MDFKKFSLIFDFLVGCVAASRLGWLVVVAQLLIGAFSMAWLQLHEFKAANGEDLEGSVEGAHL